MSDIIQVGDVVRLKSGGPDMVVASQAAKEAATVLCQWFDGGNNFREKEISPAALVKVVKATPVVPRNCWHDFLPGIPQVASSETKIARKGVM